MKIDHPWLFEVRPAFVASFLKKLLGVRRQLVTTTEGKFFVDPLSNFGGSLLAEGGYEPSVVDSVKRILEPGDTFLDLGGNEGFYSIVASGSVGTSGKVICVEPQSRLQSIIFRNISENEAYNVSVFQSALSDEVGTATLHLTPDINTGSSGLFRVTKYRNPTEIVPQTTLSRFLAMLNVGKIKLMKIDAEGSEHEIILGSKDLFRKGVVENIALELHPDILRRRGKSEVDILSFLEESGYEENSRYENLIMSKRPATKPPV